MSSQRSNGPFNDGSVTNDTFLSRVFGLNSIYNKAHDNQYPYYGQDSVLHNLSRSYQHDIELGHTGLRPDKNLLDSEHELDDSDSNAGDIQRKTAAMPSIHWSPNLTRHGREPSLAEASQTGLPSLQLTETLSSDQPAFDRPTTHQKPVKQQTNTTSNTPLQFKLQKPPPQTHNDWHRQQKRPAQQKYQISPKERALYVWANVVNMDEFLIDVYYYYRGKGFVSIVLGRCVDLLMLIFILLFTTFLKWGIDYNHFLNEWPSGSNVNLTLKDLIIPGYFLHNIPLSVKFLLFGFAIYIGLRLLQLCLDYKYKLSQLQNFYQQLLDVKDDVELMTIPWSTIVERMMLLEDYNSLTASGPRNARIDPPRVRLNAHDIANRIMRKENYMIAMINKNILNILVLAPAFLKPYLSHKQILTRTLEWNLKLCINNFVFDENGQINENILKEALRNQMLLELSSRFKMAAVINLVLCPFIVIYFVLLYFFRYFNEYKANPSSLLGLRQYTPWAEWKLREFNELSHFFIKRLHLSIGPANTYINQFPGSVYVGSLMTLINFICGAILAVLVIMGLAFDNEEHNFWSFEITEGRSALFYISIFGTLWAITSTSSNISTVTKTAENLNTQEVSFFYDPEASLRYVSQFTHYLPSSWNGRLHTNQVKNEFCELYSLKIVIVLNEVLSLILTPFILWFEISNSSSAIIDFFREYTIHVDGLGYVCYFAIFNFEEKDKNMMSGLNKKAKKKARPPKRKSVASTPETGDEDDSESDSHDYYQDDKMIKSYMYFLESYGTAQGNKKASATPARGMPQPNEGLSKSFGTGMTFEEENDGRGESDSLRDYSFNFPGSMASSVRAKEKRKGVLGMINQFSRQDNGR